MNLFNWLILGHFVADWLLQSDWMAIGKRRHFFSTAGIVHYIIYTFIILLTVKSFSAQSADMTVWLPIGAAVFFSHWLIDGSQLVRCWMRFFGQREQIMVTLVIDQTMHLLVIGAIAAWLTA